MRWLIHCVEILHGQHFKHSDLPQTRHWPGFRRTRCSFILQNNVSTLRNTSKHGEFRRCLKRTSDDPASQKWHWFNIFILTTQSLDWGFYTQYLAFSSQSWCFPSKCHHSINDSGVQLYSLTPSKWLSIIFWMNILKTSGTLIFLWICHQPLALSSGK